MKRLRPEGTLVMLPETQYADWAKMQGDCKLQFAGQESGKNAIFQIMLDSMKYVSNIVSAKKKARIVLDYDPDAENWVMTLFTGGGKPTQQGKE